TVIGDGIVVYDTLGNKQWHWSIFDQVSAGFSTGDWSHANALSYDTDGNFLISFRNFNQIWKINKSSGEIMWKLGEGGDFDLPDSLLFYQQHAVHINPLGEIMIFDNGHKEKRPTSRALSFDIESNTLKSAWYVELPEKYFSFKQGSVFFIGKNKLLFCSSMTNTILVTDLNGNVLWEAKSDESFYRAEYISDIK
ncbi:MAG: arylsulfotransferase family protein, partial [Fulvivirga sp.]|nr:arylsulfotransferase family protein [Fulvivirga sp.]